MSEIMRIEIAPNNYSQFLGLVKDNAGDTIFATEPQATAELAERVVRSAYPDIRQIVRFGVTHKREEEPRPELPRNAAQPAQAGRAVTPDVHAFG